MSRLERKVAKVTGGGTGIGKGIARCLAEEGDHVVLAQRREAVAEATAAELRQKGTQALAVACDVSLRSQVQELMRHTLDRFGQIDILINAAVTGLPAISKFLECSDEIWDNIMAVNLKGTFLCSQEAARHM